MLTKDEQKTLKEIIRCRDVNKQQKLLNQFLDSKTPEQIESYTNFINQDNQKRAVIIN